MCNDVGQCLLARFRFAFGKRWGGVPLRVALEVLSGAATSMTGASLKFRFRGCFTACWFTGVLTNALKKSALNGVMPALQCELPVFHTIDAEQIFPWRYK